MMDIQNPSNTVENANEMFRGNVVVDDTSLEEFLKQLRVRIVVIGAGGAGCNTVSRMMEVGIEGAELVAVNTDAQHLLYTQAQKKILIGRKITGGLGAGNNPKIGEEAAKEAEPELRSLLEGAHMVFVTCGLGGGTGTGASPIIAEIAKKSGALTIGVVTLPFSLEGQYRMENALEGLERLKKSSDTVIVIPNDKLLELVPDLPLNAAFKVSDEILMRAVKGITELITKPGLVNLDFADIKAVMQNGGVAHIGLGEAEGENRAEEAVVKAVNSPLLDTKIDGARGVIVNISGGTDLTLREVERVMDYVYSHVDRRALVKWGAQIDPELKDEIRVMLIATGMDERKSSRGIELEDLERFKSFGSELGGVDIIF